jgi:hypothetical protein
MRGYSFGQENEICRVAGNILKNWQFVDRDFRKSPIIFRYQKMSSQYETTHPSGHFPALFCFYFQRWLYSAAGPGPDSLGE